MKTDEIIALAKAETERAIEKDGLAEQIGELRETAINNVMKKHGISPALRGNVLGSSILYMAS